MCHFDDGKKEYEETSFNKKITYTRLKKKKTTMVILFLLKL